MLTLHNGDLSLVLAPEHGGAIVGWMRGATPLMRRALPAAAVGGDSHAMACFPLVPYCNRIGHGRFTWAGRDYAITRNFGDHPHAIHGIGWQRAWTVEAVSDVSATFTLAHAGDADWPFAFDARLTYELAADGLTVTLSATNRHDARAPMGLGLHPYFPRDHAPSLRFSASGMWRNKDALPSAREPVAGETDFSAARPVASVRLDNCFTDWDQAAHITAGPASLTVTADTLFADVQVFTPDWAAFFCVEPVSHIPDAINTGGMPALTPGATLSGWIRLAVG